MLLNKVVGYPPIHPSNHGEIWEIFIIFLINIVLNIIYKYLINLKIFFFYSSIFIGTNMKLRIFFKVTVCVNIEP